MKKVLLIGFVVLIFLAILAAILFKVFGTHGPSNAVNGSSFPTSPTATVPTDVQPDQFALAFYTWYFANYGNRNSYDVVTAHLPQWLTPEFAAKVPTIVDQTGADPFFLAQDSPPADSKISSSIVNQSTTASDVHVFFSSPTGSLTYLVHLTKATGDWRIDSVTEAP